MLTIFRLARYFHELLLYIFPHSASGVEINAVENSLNQFFLVLLILLHIICIENYGNYLV